MTIARIMLTSVVVAFATSAASAQDASPKLPDYAKTLTELSAIQPTGGAGGSGNVEVQVVTILGDAAKPGPYAQLLKVGANAQIAAHHHAGDRVGTVLNGTWHFGYGPGLGPPTQCTRIQRMIRCGILEGNQVIDGLQSMSRASTSYSKLPRFGHD